MTRHTWLEQVGLIADRGREILNLGPGGGRRREPAESLSRRLLAQRGEASGIALASELVHALETMDEPTTAAYLGWLAAQLSPPTEILDAAIDAWREQRDPASLLHLGAAAEPPRQELFRRLNMAPGGTRAIVDLRARLLGLLPSQPELQGVDADLRHLLSSWFNRGFLHLEEVGWHTPADVLERLIRYEAVHEIRGWEDLRGRLSADRRCFAFFHPALPGEPLIFVEVALTRGLARAIGPLLAPDRTVGDPAAADSAIFYSISNTQLGLRGISFGSFLLKQVVDELSAILPRLTTFATLSPLPGLAAAVERSGPDAAFSDPRLRALAAGSERALSKATGLEDPAAALRSLLAQPMPRPDPAPKLLRGLALAYLANVRRRDHVADPVAHFHLSNGARLEQVNVDADHTEAGAASYGVMVNYLYEPERLEINHERYVETGDLVTARGLASETRRVEAAWPGGRRNLSHLTGSAPGLLILSSGSGSLSQPVRRRVREAFSHWPALELEAAMDLRDLGRSASPVVLAGGDGSVARVARALAGSRRPLGIIPTGTFNNFARSLSLPEEVDRAIEVARRGVPCPVTLGRVNGQPFLQAAALGMFGTAIVLGEAAKSLDLGELGGRFRELSASRTFRYRLDGDLRGSGRALSLVFANTPTIGARLEVAEKAPHEAGLELVVQPGPGRARLLRGLLPRALRRGWGGPGRPDVGPGPLRFRRLEVATSPAAPLYADSARVGDAPALIEAWPGALRVLLPAPAP